MRLYFTLMSTLCFMLFSYSSNIFAANHDPEPADFTPGGCEIAGELLVHDANCRGSDDGLLIVNMTEGEAPFTYHWSVEAPTDFDILIDLPPGDYSVTVTDAADCSIVFSGSITEPDILFASASATNISEPGENDGAAFATPIGGTPPFTYQWDDPNNSTIPNINNLSVGTYTVTVTDANECTSVQTVTVNPSTCGLMVTNTLSQISCFGECDGSTVALVGGGDGPYAFEWNTGAITSQISGLCEGIYTVTVTDDDGCINHSSVIVVEPDLLEVEKTVHIDLGCFGTDDGVLAVEPIGGTAPFDYQWSNGANTSMISSLPAGNYSVTVTDDGGCTASLSAVVTQAPLLELSVENTTAVDCSGASSGAAAVSATGGTGNYVYEWSNGMTGNAVDGLPAGVYAATVTDASNCTATVNVLITEPAQLTVVLDQDNDISCFGADDGSIAVDVSGGTLGYDYVWSNGATTEDLSNLPPGTYELMVTDANNCTETISAEITEPAALSLALDDLQNVSCFGVGDGSISVLTSGGTAPLSAAWSNGQTGNAVENLVPGMYQVTLTDANGCSEQLGGMITQPEPLELFATVTNVDCPSSTQGSIAVSSEGGTAPYTYLWSNGSNVNPIFSLTAGNYSVTVTDDNNCEESATVIITSLDDQPPVVFTNDVNMFLNDEGTATLSLGQVNNGSFDNCGIASMTLSQSEFDCTHVGSNTVSLIVTDQAGNSAEETFEVMISDLIAPEMTCPDDILVPACEATLDYPMPIVNDNCADVIDPVLTAGLPPGATFPEGLTVVAYSFTDGGNNSAICSFEVTVKPALEVEETVTHVTCNGDADGAISVVASSGTPDYTLAWEDGFEGTEVSNLAAGIYNLTVTDADNCDEVLNIEVMEPNPVGFEINLLVNETEGFANGLIDITPTGGVGPYIFKWSLNGEFFSDQGDISGLAAGEYTLDITDANGCLYSSDPIVIENLSNTQDIMLDTGFELMPNPSRGFIRLTFDQPLEGAGLLSVWDILGQKVIEGIDVMQGAEEMPLDCSGFSNGTYFVRLDTENGSYLRKMVVSK
jgi:hypothetical protein